MTERKKEKRHIHTDAVKLSKYERQIEVDRSVTQCFRYLILIGPVPKCFKEDVERMVT